MPAQIDQVRHCCMSLPHATESVQWGNDLVFKIGGKMFAVMRLEPAKVFLSFKCSPDDFAELVERPNLIPAPYLARHHWVALESADALTAREIEQKLQKAYSLVWNKLPKKVRAALTSEV